MNFQVEEYVPNTHDDILHMMDEGTGWGRTIPEVLRRSAKRFLGCRGDA